MKKSKRVTVILSTGAICMTVTDEPELEQLQKLVGGYIERIPGFKRFNGEPVIWAYCNEDGRGLELPRNLKAEEAWLANFNRADIDLDRGQLRGDVVIIQSVKRRGRDL